MIKNIKRMALLLVAVAALLNVSCKKDEPTTPQDSTPQEEEPTPPEVIDLVGTSWRFYYEGDVQGMEIMMDDNIQIVSADSAYRAVSAVLGPAFDAEYNLSYTWDGKILTLLREGGKPFVLTYRASEDVFFRAPDPEDTETLVMMQMLGLSEIVYYRQ